MPIILELNKLLEEALSEESLDEKIMSKKKARRLRAKKRAAIKAKQEQQKKELEQAKQAEETEQENEETGTALVAFEEPKNDQFADYDEVSEVFKKAMEYFGPQLEKHKADIDKAMQMWQSAGKDKACPQEAWDILNNSINQLKSELETFINQTDFEKLPEPELLITDKVVTGLNGYIEKAQQEVMAIKPNLVEDDFKAPAEVQNTEVTTTQSTELTTTEQPQEQTGTSLVPSQNQEPKEQDKKQIDKDKRNKKKIVNYETFWKGFKDTYISLDGLVKGLKTILGVIGKGVSSIINLASQPLSWIDDRIWGFLTSPVAKDFIKTLAYSNPLTAFIFDGKLGSFGIGNAINKVHNATRSVIEKGKTVGKKDITKEKPENYTARKFPKSLEGLTLKKLRREFYSNKALIDCINVAYNHPEVKAEDKAILEKNATQFGRNIKTKKLEQAKKNFNTIIATLNNICDYMEWMKPFDWQNILTKYVKASGNTEKEQKKIDKKRQPKKKQTEEPKQMGMFTKEQWDKLSDEEKAKYPKGIRDLYQQESYKVNTKNLNKLLENNLSIKKENKMNLKSLDEIKQDGLTVFMPSGIQATLFLENDNVLVQYPNLHVDKYNKNDFQKIMDEGIFIFNDMPQNFNQIIESINENGLLNDLQTATINILTEEPELARDEVSGKMADCYKVELTDFEKSKEPFWTGYVDCNLITNIINGEPINENGLFKKELTPLPSKDASFKEGDIVTINGVKGEIIKVKPMKMSDTCTYQIKLDDGKTVWRYEEEINESLNEDYACSSSIELHAIEPEQEEDMLRLAKEIGNITDLEKELKRNDIAVELYTIVNENEFTGGNLADLENAIDSCYYDQYDEVIIDVDLDEWILEEDKLIVGTANVELIGDSNEEDFDESLNEDANSIATELRNGNKSGNDKELGQWLLKTSLDSKWETLADNIKYLILFGIADEVENGNLQMKDFEQYFDDSMDLTKEDLQSLDMFKDEEIDAMFSTRGYLTCLISYQIQHTEDPTIEESLIKDFVKKGYIRKSLAEGWTDFSNQKTLAFLGIDENQFTSKSELIKYIEENTDYDVLGSGDYWLNIIDRTENDGQEIQINLENKMREAFEDKKRKEGDVFKGLKNKKKEYLTPEFKTELLNSLDRIAREMPDVKIRQQAVTFMDELGLQEYYDTKKVQAFIKKNLEVLNAKVNEELEPADIDDIEQYPYCVEIRDEVDELTYQADFDNEEAARADFDDHKEEILPGHKIELLHLVDSEGYEVLDSVINEQFKEKKKGKKKKKLDELNKEVNGMKELREENYTVYNSIENRECGTFGSWNEVQDFLDKEWGEYKTSLIGENPDFGTEEDKNNFFGNFELATIEAPAVIEEPVEEEPKEEVKEEPQDVPEEEPQTCPDCGKEPCECETEEETEETDVEEEKEEDIDVDELINEMCMEGPKTPEEVEKEQEDDEDKEKNEAVEPKRYIINMFNPDGSVFEQLEFDRIDQAVAKFKQIRLNQYNELVDTKTDEILLEEGNKTPLGITEELKDNMGMLTDINDLDFPDALQNAVDTKEDGSLYRISDVAKMVQELKSEIASIKDEFKSALSELKQGIKDDVKDIQTDVTSKLDNTNSKIADLTSEEEADLEDIEMLEEPAEETEEEPAETEEENTEEEGMEEALQEMRKNPIYNQVKEVFESNKHPKGLISVATVAEKVHVNYGIDTKNQLTYSLITAMCEKAPEFKDRVVDVTVERKTLKESMLGKAAKWISGGLMGALAAQKENESKSLLESYAQESKANAKKQNEDANEIKQEIDKLNAEGKNDKIKATIDVMADNEEEKKDAQKYALDKVQESKANELISKLTATSKTAAFSSLNIRG